MPDLVQYNNLYSNTEKDITDRVTFLESKNKNENKRLEFVLYFIAFAILMLIVLISIAILMINFKFSKQSGINVTFFKII